MQWLADLVAYLGASGASANAAISLSEEREATVRIERFLARFDHPAGRAAIPVEPAFTGPARVA